MFRSLLFPLILPLSFVSIASVANAQSAGHPIAYVKLEGTSASIYVTNDTGIGTKKVYSTPVKTKVVALDMKPGGDELAFIESRTGSPVQLIKILSFTNGAVNVSTRTLSGPCKPSSVDYHPDGSKLIFADSCNSQVSIRTIQTNGSGLATLIGPTSGNDTGFNHARWLPDGDSFVYMRGRSATAPNFELCRNECDETNGDFLWSGSHVSWMDVARLSNTIIFSYGTYIHKLNADTGVLMSNVIAGYDGHFSPDDNRILYESNHPNNSYLEIKSNNGSISRISGKGDYWLKDWRY